MSHRIEGPRIRGRCGQAEEPEDIRGKWMVEMSIWDTTGTSQLGEPWLFGPFDDEKSAREHMRKMSEKMSRFISKEMSGEESDDYFDLANGGVLRSWNEN